MLLAEALAARKDAISEIDALGHRLAAAALRYEDDDAAGEAPTEIVSRLSNVLERFEALTVQINRTNSETHLAFDGRHLSVMEAIALRTRLTMEARARRMAVDAVEQVSGRAAEHVAGSALVAARMMSESSRRSISRRNVMQRTRSPRHSGDSTSRSSSGIGRQT
jgi:hypothetical protein